MRRVLNIIVTVLLFIGLALLGVFVFRGMQGLRVFGGLLFLRAVWDRQRYNTDGNGDPKGSGNTYHLAAELEFVSGRSGRVFLVAVFLG